MRRWPDYNVWLKKIVHCTLSILHGSGARDPLGRTVSILDAKAMAAITEERVQQIAMEVLRVQHAALQEQGARVTDLESRANNVIVDLQTQAAETKAKLEGAEKWATEMNNTVKQAHSELALKMREMESLQKTITATIVSKVTEVEGNMSATSTRTGAEIIKMKVELEEWAVKVRKDLLSTGGVTGGTGSHKRQLLNAKDTPVMKLRDGCTRDEFLHWKRSVEVHLESLPLWKHATKLLRKVRGSKTEVTEQVVGEARLGVGLSIF